MDIDWDGDGAFESSVQHDINGDGQINITSSVTGQVTFLTDHDDWALIDERGLRCVRANETTNPPTRVSSRD